MKLSIENFPLRQKFGEEKALKMIKDAGFDGIDYSFNAAGNGSAIDLCNHTRKAKEVKRMLDSLGLTCVQAHAPFGFQYGFKFNMSDKSFSDTVRAMEFAALLGAKNIVVHCIYVPENTDFFDYNYNFYKALEPYAQDFGISIAVENLVNSIFWRPDRLSHFIRLLESPVFSACVDVGHSMLMGIPPEDYISGMDKGVLKCVHIQDTGGKTDDHLIPYQGVHNWDNIIKALAKYGYTGDLSLEVIHCFDNLPGELYFPLTTYAAQVGRVLINKFEQFYKSN